MTSSRSVERRPRRTAVKRMSAAWKRHFKRIDNLPKPVKPISARQVRKLLGV